MAAVAAVRQLRSRSRSIWREVFVPFREESPLIGAAASAVSSDASALLWRSHMTSAVHSWLSAAGRPTNWRIAFPSARYMPYFVICAVFSDFRILTCVIVSFSAIRIFWYAVVVGGFRMDLFLACTGHWFHFHI